MTAVYTDDEIREIIEQSNRDREDRDAQYLGTVQDPGQMVSEQMFYLISGVNEVDKELKAILPEVLHLTNQYMHLDSKADYANWDIDLDSTIDIYNMEHPHHRLTQTQTARLKWPCRRNFNRSKGGFERQAVTTSTTQILHQQMSNTPTSAAAKASGGIGAKIAALFGGKK